MAKVKARVALVTGASGLVGQALVPALTAAGYTVRTLVRDKALVGGDAYFWQPDAGEIDVAALEGADVVFHLAGTGIADKRWTSGRMAYLLANRSGAAATLFKALGEAKQKPNAVIIASAIGFYGTDAGVADESTPRGDGFAGDVCAAIEESFPENELSRTVHARLGIVLGDGGALAKMLPAFKVGAGGRLGSGTQPFAWVHISDVVRGLMACAENKKLVGAVNIVAPAEDDNAGFNKALGAVLGRPAVLPMPAFMVRIFFGQMGEELLLNGRHVAPRKLAGAGFEFGFKDVGGALRDVLGK